MGPFARSCVLWVSIAASGYARGAEQDLSALRSLADAVQAPGGQIDVPCLSSEAAPAACSRHALTTFFSALEVGESEAKRGAPVRMVVFGNSLISADGIIGFLRRRLTDRFGDGGRGLVLADRMGPWGPRARTGVAHGRWTLSTVGMLEAPKLPHGVTGAQHQAGAPNAKTEYSLQGETKAELWWLSVEGKKGFRVEVDGKSLAAFQPLRVGSALRAQVEIPEGARRLGVVADGAGPVVQGVVLERESGGIVVDTLGVPSVDASLFLRTNEQMFQEQLAARSPSLVTVMLGGNEVKRLAWHRATPESQEADLRALIRRTRAAAPNASCLVVGPIDSVRGPGSRAPFEQRPELDGFLALQRRVAREESCAYFDLFQAMGGTGALKRFHARGLIHPDLVHPRGKGLDLLGELISAALLRAYDGRTSTALVSGERGQ